MKKIKLGEFSLWAFRLICLCTAMVCALACLSGILTLVGNTPLQHFILTRQLLRRIPAVFLSGLFTVVLCEIISRSYQKQQ